MLGWMLELEPLAIVAIVMVYTVVKRKYNGKSVAFVQPGPLMSPNKMWSARPDRPMPKEFVENEGFEDAS